MARLGSSDIDVLPLALGANTFGWTADRRESFAILDAFTAGGGSLVDTADGYSHWSPGNSGGESETIIGEWLAAGGSRERLVIATKVGRHPRHMGLKAGNIALAIEDSLRRLQTDTIDVYFAHRDDPDTPIEETVAAFQEQVERGVVRYVGLSNYTAERAREWLDAAKRLGAALPVSIQPHYNLLVREPFESELRPLASEYDLGVIPYYGLAAGFLTGKYRSPEDAEGVARSSMVRDYLNDAGFELAAELRALANERGVPAATMALAWLRMQPTVVAPIAGASSLEQVEPLLAAAGFELDASELERLDRVSRAFAEAVAA